MAADINSVNLTARLAADPELRSTAGGTAVCNLRVAFNVSKKNADGSWEDVGHFMNVTVWAGLGESVARNLQKGALIGITGRLEHRTWETQEGQRREAHSIVAERIKYLSPKSETATTPPATPAPAFGPADDDIPF